MQLRSVGALVLATVLASAPACAQGERGSATRQCTNDAEVTLTVGQRVELRATSASGIPYQWRVRNDGTVLESVPTEPTTQAEGRPMPGGPVAHVWTFVAVREGSQELRADLVSLGPEATVAESVQCRVVARGRAGGGEPAR